MSVVGVDACRRGWVAVELRAGEVVAAHFLPTIGAIAEACPAAEVVAIDIPIGLPESGRRLADVEAKALLGPRQNSVFFTPPRAALTAATHAEGTARSVALTGFGMSQQAYALRDKVMEVERWAPMSLCPVIEVHPEVCFAEMLGGPASAPKKSWQGMVERYRVLATAGIFLEELTGDAARAASVDDMLDAGAAAWTAARFQRGEARSLPHLPPTDPGGRSTAIWV